MRSLPLQAMGTAVRQRVDLNGQQNATFGSNSGYITDAEIIAYLNASVSELWGKIVAQFGDNYYWNQFTFSPLVGTSSYTLPFDFLKELAIDVALDNSGLNWASVRPFTTAERNMYTFSVSASFSAIGFTSLRYQLQGSKLSFIPYSGPYPSQIRVTYVPAPPQLVITLPALYSNGTTYGTQGTLVYAVVNDSTIGNVNQVFQSLNTGSGSSGATPSWTVPGVTTDAAGVNWAYLGPLSSFAQTFDGIAGWEDYAILDAAIKCGSKQEMDTSAFQMQKDQMSLRIDQAAANRQGGEPMSVVGGFGALEDGGPFGYGWGFGWG